MTEINRAGEAGSLGHIDSTQRDFREQIDALNDAVRQLGGNPEIKPGLSVVNDPLSAPYVLYVDPYIGTDTFVSGDYAAADSGTFEDKMRRISLQRLECGYTQSRPFRTISRAVIEAGIITSRDYLNLPGSLCGDLVSIVVAPGVHHILNGPGTDTVSAWTDGKKPTDDELSKFNPPIVGGLILPRGCSVISLDLRKTILRPTSVPTRAFETSYDSRRAIFKMTGGGYYFGFTFMDKEGATESHHLLDCFQYASKQELDKFYGKIRDAFGPAAGVSDVNAVTRTSEYQIVGEMRDNASVVTDTVRSASPYIYNTSVRSTLGLCGIFADGSRVDGFKSIVVAQFTGASLQNDYKCWQKYNGSSWVTVADTTEFLSLDPDDIRMDPRQRSFHVRAVNEAVIQEVSVFAIGQGIHHWAETGAQLTVTNSNSNFGGCAGLAEGYQTKVAKDDGTWTLDTFRTALNPLAKSGNIKRITLGTLEASQSDSATTLNFTADLRESPTVSGQPDILARDGYSLKENDYIWVENPGGADYRAQLANNPWSVGSADQIKIKTAVETDTGESPGNPDLLNEFPSISSKRVYVRRVFDVRSVEERRYSILASNNTTSKLRLPLRDYVLAPLAGASYGPVVQAVAASERLVNEASDIKIELRYSNKPDADKEFSSSTYYRKGDVVVRKEKHYTAVRTNYGAFDAANWDESFVHMGDKYTSEGFYTNAQPLIVFDKDTDGSESSLDLGNDIDDTAPAAQIESAVDRLGLYYYLQNLNTPAATINGILAPADTEADRNTPAASQDFEVRRPTNIRLFGHAYEWAGYGNYSRALPQYQGEMSPSNKFTYYFTNESGGKVYATGFNEEGLQVTPRGLEDITTGEVLSVTDVGNPDRDIDVPTEFVDLKVEKSITLGFGDIGKVEDHALVAGTNSASGLSDFGFIKLAGITDLEQADAAGKDSDINEQPLAVTPLGLNYWKIKNNILSAPDGAISIFIDPVNGEDRPLTELVSNPPTQSRNPVKTLVLAAEYVNTIYAPQTVANFYCGPGIYYDKGVGANNPIVFKTQANLRAWDFSRGVVLNDDKSGGSVPFLGQNSAGKVSNISNFNDPTKQPTFLTLTTLNSRAGGTQATLGLSPLTLLFEQQSTITGFAWYGAAQTLFSDKVDDSFWDNTDTVDIAGTRAAITSEENALDVFVEKQLPRFSGAGNSLFALGGGSYRAASVTFNQEGTMTNCAIGAVIPGPAGEVAVDGQGVVQTRGSNLTLRGIWLIGNVKLSDNGGKYAFRGESSFEFWGHQESLVYTDSRNRPEDGVLLKLGGIAIDGTSTDYNLTWNNIHLVNNNRAVATTTSADNFNAMGPALGSVVAYPSVFSMPIGGNWSGDKNQTSGDYQGFNGKFGLLKNYNNALLVRTRGIFGYDFNANPLSAPGGFRSLFNSDSFMVAAGTGNKPADSGYPTSPGTPGPDEDFDDLNVTVLPFAKGIDVNTAVTIRRNCKL